MQDGTHSWGDCWGCSFAVVDQPSCGRLGATEEACSRLGGVPPAFVSYYAPQIAWWLSFFPPERFLIFTSEQLHDQDQQLKVGPPASRVPQVGSMAWLLVYAACAASHSSPAQRVPLPARCPAVVLEVHHLPYCSMPGRPKTGSVLASAQVEEPVSPNCRECGSSGWGPVTAASIIPV